MMKHYFALLVGCGIIFTSTIKGHSQKNAFLTTKEYQEIKNLVEFIQGKISVRRSKNFIAATKKGAKIGATSGAITGGLGAYMFFSDQNPDPRIDTILGAAGAVTGTAIGTGVGAAGGATISLAKRKYILWQLNSILRHYAAGTFENLSLNQAIAIMAAYKKNLFIMTKIAPYIHNFLNTKNNWKLLAHLYFNAPPTTEEVWSLKAMLTG